MRRKRYGDHWRWALAAAAVGLFAVALASGGCDAVSGIDDLAFERGPGTFCESFDDCADGNYCDYQDRVCRPQLPIGAECTANEQCASEEARTGRCAHGYCCNGPCTGDCFACDVPMEEGTCQVLKDETDPHDDCPGTTGCGQDGQCRGHVKWTFAHGDARGDVATGVVFDAQRNIVVVGTFHDNIHFGDALLPSQGASDVFVAKFNHDGELLWSRGYGGPGVDTVAGIALDSAGNAWVAGDFEDAAKFSETLTLTAVGGRDVFLMKIGGDGVLLSARQLGPANDQRASAIAVDAMDRVILTGSFVESIEYGGNNTGNGNPSEDAFVVVYQPNNSVAWHRELGDLADAQRGRAVAVSGEHDVVVAIEGRGTVESLVGSTTDDDAYFLRLDGGSGATALSQLLFGGIGNQYVSDVDIDSRENIWIVGSFTEHLKPPGASEAFETGDDLDGYFAVYTPVFQHVRSGSLGGSFDNVPLALAIDGDDEVTVVGRFQLELHMGDDGVLQGVGDNDIFVLKLTSQGDHQWAESFGGPLFDQALAVVADTSTDAADPFAGELAVVGSFQASVDLGGTVLAATGQSDLYAALLAP